MSAPDLMYCAIAGSWANISAGDRRRSSMACRYQSWRRERSKSQIDSALSSISPHLAIVLASSRDEEYCIVNHWPRSRFCVSKIVLPSRFASNTRIPSPANTCPERIASSHLPVAFAIENRMSSSSFLIACAGVAFRIWRPPLSAPPAIRSSARPINTSKSSSVSANAYPFSRKYCRIAATNRCQTLGFALRPSLILAINSSSAIL